MIDVAAMLTAIWDQIPTEVRDHGLGALALLGVGLAFARVLQGVVRRIARRVTSEHYAILLARAVSYGLSALIVAGVLRMVGFDLSVVLGVAGVATVAVGFAAQTSMSNLISGLFLVIERPFAVGDVLEIGGTSGVVTSIDLLSVKLRTFDNLFVRIPNESLVKAELTNLTRYPIRRLVLKIGVDVDADLGRVKEVLLAAIGRCGLALDEPPARVMLTGIVEHGATITIAVWGETSSYLELRDQVIVATQRALGEAGVPLWSSRRLVRVEVEPPVDPITRGAAP